MALATNNLELYVCGEFKKKSFVLVGDTGSGKTSILHDVASSYHVYEPSLFPVILLIDEHLEKIEKDLTFTLEDAWKDSVASSAASIPSEWLREQISNKKCLIIIDGLDELKSDESHQLAIKWIVDQKNSYTNCQFLISVETLISDLLSQNGFICLSIKRFTSKQIAKHFEHYYISDRRWFKYHRLRNHLFPGTSSLKKEMKSLNHRTYQTLKYQPYAVSLLFGRSFLCSNKYFSQNIMLLSELRKATRELINPDPDIYSTDELIAAMETLGYIFIREGCYEIPREKLNRLFEEELNKFAPNKKVDFLLETIESHTGLMQKTKRGNCRFSSKFLNAYFAAEFLSKQDLSGDYLNDKIGERWWIDTLHFLSMLENGNEVLKKIITTDVTSIETVRLIIKCMCDKSDVDSNLKKEVQSFLRRTIESPPDANLQIIRYFVGEFELHQNLSSIGFMRNTANLVAPNCICVSNIEYQVFLEDMFTSNMYFQPDQWLDKRFPPDGAFEPVKGVRGMDAWQFCRWLSVKYGDSWNFRLPVAGEVRQTNMLVNPQLATWWIFNDSQFFLDSMSEQDPTVSYTRFQENWLDKTVLFNPSLALDCALSKSIELSSDNIPELSAELLRSRQAFNGITPTVNILGESQRSFMIERAFNLAELLKSSLLSGSTPILNKRKIFRLEGKAKPPRNLEKLANVMEIATNLIRGLQNSIAYALEVYQEEHLSNSTIFNKDQIRLLDQVVLDAYKYVSDFRAGRQMDILSRSRAVVEVVCIYSLAISNMLIEILNIIDNKVPLQQKESSNYLKWKNEMESLSRQYMSVFNTFWLVEERISGETPATEGLYIIVEPSS